MAKFKFLPIYIVDAKNKTEAKEIFAKAQKNGTLDEFFEVLIVKEVEPQGWGDQFKSQLGFGRKK